MRKPLLVDLDGVLRIGNKPAEDIIPFLSYINEKSINACVISNSSLYSSKTIYQFFNQFSISINVPILTAIDAAKIYIENKYRKVAVYTADDVIELFMDVLDYENPEAVLIGDIGEKWNYKLLQQIFEYANNGAELVAVHKNKFWEKPGKGLQLDAGPFIHAIEYATSTSATLIGKPSKVYFQSALNELNADPNSQFIMLGDDLETDIKGSKNLGAQTILIYTGKTKKGDTEKFNEYIDFEANNLVDVISILNTIND